MESVKVSLFLDTRKDKQTKEGKRKNAFSVSLRIWDPMTRSAKIRKTGISLTETQFERAWMGQRLNTSEIAIRGLLQDALSKVTDAIAEMEFFSYEKLDEKLSTPKGEVQNMMWHFEKKVAALREQGRIGTADGYKYTAKIIEKYSRTRRIPFSMVTVKWLEAFERWGLAEGKSITTVGIYARNIRVLFNDAIEEGIITREQYPFGKRKYVVPTGKGKKRALSGEQLRVLLDAEPQNKEQRMAKDFFFFSYAANGMNIRDIVYLKHSDVEEERFSFVREKTKNSRRQNPSPIFVYWMPMTKKIVGLYGTSPAESKYVFPFITDDMTEDEKYYTVRNFTRYVNQHIKILANDNGLPDISTYWARHSYATFAVQKGASMEFMQESLGHADMKTTQNYFAGFTDETKKEFAKTIMDF